MKVTNWNQLCRVGVLAGLVLSSTMSVATAQEKNDEEKSGRLEGTWSEQVTVRICGSGAKLFTFPSLATYNSGGTTTDTTAGASPSLRSPGHGKWEKTGKGTYNATILALLFTPAGTWSGTQRLSIAIVVTGDEMAFTTTSETFDTGGILELTACATGVGHRL